MFSRITNNYIFFYANSNLCEDNHKNIVNNVLPVKTTSQNEINVSVIKKI